MVVFLVFSLIRRMDYFRLGYVIGPAGTAAGARNRRKAIMKIRRNPALRILFLIHIISNKLYIALRQVYTISVFAAKDLSIKSEKAKSIY